MTGSNAAVSGPVAVIADIVESRAHPDRAGLQAQVESVLASCTGAHLRQPFTATLGDEFQAVFDSLPAALTATLHIQLEPSPEASLRFGLGLGDTTSVPSRTSDRIQDGPGWWYAREAIEHVEALQARHPGARTWFRGPETAQEAVTNAYLLLRDQQLDAMSVRARGYARGAAQGMSQQDIAARFGVTQSAVSQSLRRTGATALIEGLNALDRFDAADRTTRAARTEPKAEEERP